MCYVSCRLNLGVWGAEGAKKRVHFGGVLVGAEPGKYGPDHVVTITSHHSGCAPSAPKLAVESSEGVRLIFCVSTLKSAIFYWRKVTEF